MENFNILSGTRPEGFGTAGRFRLSDIWTIYNADEWNDAIPFNEYVGIMLVLDKQWREWHKDRHPPSRN